MRKPIAVFLALIATCCALGAAAEPGPADRKALLDAARPQAAAKAGQPVRIKVDRLNVDRGWAVLVGSLVPAAPAASGKGGIDWDLADGCHPALDKMLWVVLHKAGTTWRVKHIDICASEPPYWYLEQYGGLVWPCGVYAGLDDGGEGGTLESRCRKQQQARRKP